MIGNICKERQIMRIISGKARGTNLYTLKGNQTRPTLDRTKESLFNILQNDIQDCVFLDLFSGSGAIGLEAASRGAKKVILCDKSKDAIKIIQKNIEKTHSEKEAKCYNLDFKELLQTKIHEKMDIIFIDPPYETNFACQAVKTILENNLLKEDSIVIIETDDDKRILQQIECLDIQIINHKKYGRAHLIFLKQRYEN